MLECSCTIKKVILKAKFIADRWNDLAQSGFNLVWISLAYAYHFHGLTGAMSAAILWCRRPDHRNRGTSQWQCHGRGLAARPNDQQYCAGFGAGAKKIDRFNQPANPEEIQYSSIIQFNVSIILAKLGERSRRVADRLSNCMVAEAVLGCHGIQNRENQTLRRFIAPTA